MNEFCAIMGLCNLKHVEAAIADRKRIFTSYKEKLEKMPGVRLLVNDEDPDLVRNYAYFPIIIGSEFHISRNELYTKLAENGIRSRKYFYPLTSDQACFKNLYKNADIATARDLSNRVLVLPIYEGLEEENIERIVNTMYK